MERNFFRRVEVCFPIVDVAIRSRILRDLELYLSDNTQAWVLQPEGAYQRVSHNDTVIVNAQNTLLKELSETL
jgi:polyphosphate kinase